MNWRCQLAAAILILPAVAAPKSGIIQVTSVRSWSHTDSTRVIIETTGPVEYLADRAFNPDRLFFDVLHASPLIDGKRHAARQIDDAFVQRVRIAETMPGTTRIVFDLTGQGSYTVTRLEAPNRLVIEIRAPEGVVRKPKPVMLTYGPPPLPEPLPMLPPRLPDVGRIIAFYRPPKSVPFRAPMASENASRSLTRALGLKVNRIVIDAGHGGHDEGTRGAGGLLEKDVVLDVALRLAKLVQSRLGADVLLTRSNDTFVALEERTAIANAGKADLFLSIHANSSPSPVVAGTETFFLNFTNSASALDVAARENSGSAKSVGELKDLISSITLNDKIAESQTFAQTIQDSIFAQVARSNAAAKNRGVKRAPFVVLIGASMPSVLAEIGFLTNSREESNLSKADYRQKIAEALYKGLAQYSQSLSHFQVALN
jgi:N-acetylmuramoyl-L-alanine amidase